MLNPSHLLIARNGPLRSPAEPHITSSSFSLAGGPSSRRDFASTSLHPQPVSASHSKVEHIDQVDIHPTFCKRTGTDGGLEGTVKIVVQGHVFWCHKEVLFFASPFFEAILSGDWAETRNSPDSLSSSVDIDSAQPRLNSKDDEKRSRRESTRSTRKRGSSRSPTPSRAYEQDKDGSCSHRETGLGSPEVSSGESRPIDPWKKAALLLSSSSSSASSSTDDVSTTNPVNAPLHPSLATTNNEMDHALRTGNTEQDSVYVDAFEGVDGDDGGEWVDEDDVIEAGKRYGSIKSEDRFVMESTNMSSRGVQTDSISSVPPLATLRHPTSPVPTLPPSLTPFQQSNQFLSSSNRHSFSSSILTVRSWNSRRGLKSRVVKGGRPNISVGDNESRDRDRRTRRAQRRVSRTRTTRTRDDDTYEALIELQEQNAQDFHDFLCWIYPHLDCLITWNNVEGLISLADKLQTPSLMNASHEFLMSHAAGSPIKTMQIAETYGYADLYREGSRFVLDNMGSWEPEELAALTKDTVIKLHSRKSWYLERLMKLQIANMMRDYQCCASCPDPSGCARTVDDKWRQAYLSAWRFGSPQPSIIYRYCRQLETSPPLILTHTACQAAAKAWFATLFDRMFANQGSVPIGRQKHFLYINLAD